MLLIYSLLQLVFFASVAARKPWKGLQDNVDHRLTLNAENYYWYRVKDSGTFQWPRDGKYDDFMQLHTRRARVVAISFFMFHRILQGTESQGPDEYHVHIPPNGEPFTTLAFRGPFSTLRLSGLWGRSRRHPTTVSDFRKAYRVVSSHSSSQVGPNGPIVRPEDLEVIIEIQWSKSLVYQVYFLETPAYTFTTAPMVYKLTVTASKTIMEEEERKKLAENPHRQSGLHQPAGTALKPCQVLIYNTDPRLTDPMSATTRYCWYRLKSKGASFSWSLDGKLFDLVIQFTTPPTVPHGVSDGSAQVPITPWVSGITFLRVQREFRDPDKYCLHVPHHPYVKYNCPESLNDIRPMLQGLWGRLNKPFIPVSDFRKAW
jgi:hypothetical protein